MGVMIKMVIHPLANRHSRLSPAAHDNRPLLKLCVGTCRYRAMAENVRFRAHFGIAATIRR